MQTWEYNRGTWTAIEDPLREFSEPDFESELHRAGYERDGYYGGGGEYTANFALWEMREKTPITERYPMLIFVELTGDGGSPVYLPDLPSQLMFLREFAPLVQRQHHLELLQSLEMAMRKGFQAWHEHDVDDICMQCDPVAMRARRI